MIYKQPETIELQPSIDGPHGRAWRLDLDALYAGHKTPDDQKDSIAAWIVEAAWAHPVWHSYAINLMRLDLLPDPKIYIPGATHEILLEALNPDEPRLPAIVGECIPSALAPANFAAQMICESHEAAIKRVKHAVELITQGTLSPDTDFIWQWISLFGDSMIRLSAKPSPSEKMH